MKYMLDTIICIFIIKNKSMSMLGHLSEKRESGNAISAITLAELGYGGVPQSLVFPGFLALRAFRPLPH